MPNNYVMLQVDNQWHKFSNSACILQLQAEIWALNKTIMSILSWMKGITMVAQLALAKEPQDSYQQNLACNFGKVFLLCFIYLIYRNVKPT